MTDIISIELKETHQLIRLPCTVCGGMNERAHIMAMGECEHGKIRICMFCHKAGDIDAKLEKTASQYEESAQALRSIKGRLELPPYETWEEAERRYDDAVLEEYRREGNSIR